MRPLEAILNRFTPATSDQDISAAIVQCLAEEGLNASVKRHVSSIADGDREFMVKFKDMSQVYHAYAVFVASGCCCRPLDHSSILIHIEVNSDLH